MDTQITKLLNAWRNGDRAAGNALANEIYPVLHGLAAGQVRRNGGRLTLCATELAHEAYERLHRQRKVDWQNRDQFFALAATLVRRVVIDHIRQRSAEKRGGETVFVSFEEALGQSHGAKEHAIDWLGLDAALIALAQEEEACARVVELRVFAGLTIDEVAGVLGSSTATVGRQWRFARTWLAERLSSDPG